MMSFGCDGSHRDLHSFPTRRSSDLDLLQGAFCEQLRLEVGDFVLRRADGLFAYQLAVVVDDAEQGVNAVDRKSTRLNSSHVRISYAVFCLKRTILRNPP